MRTTVGRAEKTEEFTFAVLLPVIAFHFYTVIPDIIFVFLFRNK